MKHTLWYKEGNRLDYKPVHQRPLSVETMRTQRSGPTEHEAARSTATTRTRTRSRTCRTTTSSSTRTTACCSMRWSRLKAQDDSLALPPLLPRRRVRLRRDEHQRQERPRLHHQDRRAARARHAAAAARPAGDPRPDRRHDAVLQAVPLDQAVRDQQRPAAGARAAAVAAGARGAERPLRVHPVRLLLDRLPVVLVEPGQVRRPGRACCRPTASSPTPATRRPPSASTTSRTRTACSAATPS